MSLDTKNRAYSRILLSCIVVFVVFALDFLSKQAAIQHLQRDHTVFIPGLLDFVLVYNQGAAFSIGEGHQWFFIIIAVSVCIGTLFWIYRNSDMPRSLVVSLACVVGGGAGNLYDRLVHGMVTDFIATSFIAFPVFNVADIFISVGILVSMWLYWRWDTSKVKDANLDS